MDERRWLLSTGETKKSPPSEKIPKPVENDDPRSTSLRRASPTPIAMGVRTMDINLASIAGNLRPVKRRHQDICETPTTLERRRFSRLISRISVILVAVSL
jgi:hypothetical protein